MRYYSSSLLESASWYSFCESSIGKSRWYFPSFSDPSILLPSESPDGKWHMFCHTKLGIHHYLSESGLNWKTRGFPVFFRGHSPFIYREGTKYYMLFERHDFNRDRKDVTKDCSRIYLSRSEDLFKWSEPSAILDSSGISRASYRMGPSRLARPQLISWEGKYILYFGAGEARMFDTGQRASARFMAAESDFIDGPYRVLDAPILEIEPDSLERSLAAGSVSVYPCSDAVFAVECSYVYDREGNRSRSLMLLLKSSDAFSFEKVKVMMSEPEEGFASRAITGADLKYMESDDTWYCFYSANNYERHYPFVRDGLGLLLGKSRI